MSEKLQILHLEDDPSDAALVKEILDGCVECQIMHVRTGPEFEAALERTRFDVVLSDYALPGYDGFAALRTLRAKDDSTPFIIVSGRLGEEQAIESLKNGATDYVLKQGLSRLAPAIRRAVVEARDRAKREQAEAQVRAHAMFLDKARDAIFVRDLKNRIIFWNKGAERIYGWTAEEALGKDANQLLACRAQPHDRRKWLMEQGDWIGEIHQRTKTNKEVLVQSRWTLMQDQGTPKCVLVINTDITEAKKIEAQFLRTQRMESIGALAGGIAHDLNNMLSPIMMAVDLLRASQTPENKEILEMVATSTQRGRDMVKQVLSFARGASGKHGVADVKHIIKDMARLVKDTFPRSILIEHTVADNLWRGTGNPTQLHQVLLNLCVNARDAMSSGGVLKIVADNVNLKGAVSRWKNQPVSGPHVRVRVSDTGRGIPPEVMDRLFDPFFTTKEVGQGMGLGLCTVLGIVKHHDGFVDVVSQVGRGTTFTVYVPAAEARATGAPETPGEMPKGNGEQILLIDDEIALVEMTRLMLEAYNYQVLTATDGAAAVRVYEERRAGVQIVITDIMMPVMDGAATIRALQKINPAVKIVSMSGLGSVAFRSSISGLHVAASLQKPYSTEELLRTIRRVLQMDLAA